ncbi:MAG TPA: nuclear transport factor 2 family protein [Thermomicrobiaceae bacterium]|nr:nuclear transport factor 2 family protein [Thermomicrobiaceae bacterium]
MTGAHDQAIQALFARWVRAELDGDAAALAELLDPDFRCVGPLGFVLNREQYVAPRRSGALAHTAFVWEDAAVRRYGDAAVAVGTQRQTTTFQGRDASGRFRVTQVLIRRGDGWAIASLQLSPIAPPPMQAAQLTKETR